MRALPALLRREAMSLLLSPMSYLIWAFFLFATGYLFTTSLKDGGNASLASTFNQMGVLMVFAVPLLTMRLVAEELQRGTLEVLLSDPVSETAIVLSKYLATLGWLLLMLLPTLAYPLALSQVADPDPGPMISGYVGLVAMGAMFVAVGLCASAGTGHHIGAAILSFTILLVGWILGRAADGMAPGMLRELLGYISVFSQFSSFQRGVLDTRALIYCGSVAVFCLFLATQLLSLRRLR